MKKYLLILMLLVCINSAVYAVQDYSYDISAANNKAKTLKHSIVTVPAGETFKAVFLIPVNSETAYTGQQISLALNRDFYYEGRNIAPAGSAISGTVIEVSKARHGSINGKMTIRFTQLVTPTGLEIPISAIIKTDDKTGVIIGGNPIEEEAISEIENLRRGTTISSVAGSGGGLVKSIWDKGSEVNIPANTAVELILTQPITVNPANN